MTAEPAERAEKTEATAAETAETAESEDRPRRGGETVCAGAAEAADGAEAPDTPETAEAPDTAEELEALDPAWGTSSMMGRVEGTSWMMPVGLEVAEGAGAALPRSCRVGSAAAASAEGADMSTTRIGLTVLKVCTGRRRTRRLARAASDGALALRGLDDSRPGPACPGPPAEPAVDWLTGRSGRTWWEAPGGPAWRPPRPDAVAGSWDSVVMRCDSF
ncbi:hypothetical protein B6G06_01045 [Actinomyces gaoshouyii]|nr:hypothetical protein B6G06_01045 [Actinomyces gaoshouyii]